MWNELHRVAFLKLIDASNSKKLDSNFSNVDFL